MASPLLLLFGALALSAAASGPVGQAPQPQPEPRQARGAAAPTEQVTVGVLLPDDALRSPWARPRVEPALRLALEAPRLRHAQLAFASAEHESGACSAAQAELGLMGLKGGFHSLDVLLGPVCGEPAGPAGHVAPRRGLPFLAAGPFRSGPSGGEHFNTTVNIGPTAPGLGVFLVRLHRRFRWTSRAALLYSFDDDHGPHYPVSCRALQEQLPHFAAPDHSYRQPDEALQFIRENGRVVHITGPVEMLHAIMHLAQDHNMTNGDYVFIYLDLYGQSLRAEGHREAAKPWQSKESQDAGGLQEAFRSVLVVTAHEPQTPEYRRFQSQLILRAQRDFGVGLNESLENLVAGYFHDGLLLYGMALNETLHEGGTKKNFSRILDKMRGRKFPGVTGMVIMNSNGERETDFDLRSMADVESGEYQVVGHYLASEKQIKWTGPIHWKKGRPPLDNPPCVFDKDDPSCGHLGWKNM